MVDTLCKLFTIRRMGQRLLVTHVTVVVVVRKHLHSLVQLDQKMVETDLVLQEQIKQQVVARELGLMVDLLLAL